MGFGLDDVTKTLDTAGQMLAGGKQTSNAPTTDKATYVKGIHIDTEDEVNEGAVAPKLLNEKDSNLLLEFIHFGHVHTSYSHVFPHPSYQDTKKEDKIVDKIRPRAIQFRSALVREVVLLSVFMECTQTVLKKRDDDKASGGLMGNIGSAMSTLGSLTGIGGGGGSGQTTDADVDPHIQKAVAAIKPLLNESIKYPDTHQAGMDLHQARADYRALLTKITKDKPAADPASSLLGKLPGLSSVAGPIGDIIAMAQAIAFKSEDVKVKFFALIAAQQEPQIEDACHGMTMQAIADTLNPVLPVWFGDPNAKAKDSEWENAPDSPVQKADRSNMLAPIINPVADVASSGRDTAVGGVNKVKSFFENPTPATPPPGTDFLSQAFQVPPPKTGKKDPMPMALGALAVRSFIEALDQKSPLNSFCEGIITAIYGITLDFVHGTYEALLIRDPSKAITSDDLHEAAASRLKIAERLESIALDQLGFIKKIKETPITGPMGLSLRPGDLIDKGADKLDAMIEEKVTPLMAVALKAAMDDLADALDLARKDGNANNCLTMEWYLGRLPWVQSTLFCNLFFPFWDALMKCVMGMLDKATGSALGAIIGAADKAKGLVKDARDLAKKATKLMEAAEASKQRAQRMTTVGDVAALGDNYKEATQATADDQSGPDALKRGSFTSPVQGNPLTGTGEKVTQSIYDPVAATKHQWETADPPPQPKPGADDSPSWASAT